MGGFVGPIIAGLSALAGGFNKQKQVSDTTSNNTSTTTPNYDPATLAFKNHLMSLFNDNLNSLPTQDQYQTSGLKKIAGSSASVNSGLNDILASRGLSRTSAGGSSAFDTSYQEGKGISDFLTNAPFSYQAAIKPTFDSASSFLSSLPVGNTTTSSGSSHTTGTGGPSSPVAGAIQGGSQGIAGYLGQIQAQNSLQNILKSLGRG